jgi:type IV fimbrial biogenesis protein FimT
MMNQFNEKGFTLFELIISLFVIGVMSAFGIASYQGIMANHTLSYRTDQIYYTLQFAKSEAVKRNKKIYVHFCQQASIWKMGISEEPYCDCFSTNACHLDGIEYVQELVDGKTLFIDEGAITFTGDQTSYGALRFSVETGAITLKNNQQNALSIIQSAMRLRVCAPTSSSSLLGYPKC